MVNHGRNRVSSPDETEYNNRWTGGSRGRGGGIGSLDTFPFPFCRPGRNVELR